MLIMSKSARSEEGRGLVTLPVPIITSVAYCVLLHPLDVALSFLKRLATTMAANTMTKPAEAKIRPSAMVIPNNI